MIQFTLHKCFFGQNVMSSLKFPLFLALLVHGHMGYPTYCTPYVSFSLCLMVDMFLYTVRTLELIPYSFTLLAALCLSLWLLRLSVVVFVRSCFLCQFSEENFFLSTLCSCSGEQFGKLQRALRDISSSEFGLMTIYPQI